jgi:hypothetical protein
MLSVLLGLVATVALAWLGAAFEKAYGGPRQADVLVFDGHTSMVGVTRGWLITRNTVCWRLDADQASANPSWINVKANGWTAQVPYWSKGWLPEKPTRPPGTWGNCTHEAGLDELAAGWPFRALLAETDEPVQDPVTRLAVYSFRGGMTLPTHVIKDGATIFLPRALPCTPIWPGLVADVVVFSVAWWLVLMAVGLVRARRMRRGLCLACGYDLHGLAVDAKCPECGVARGVTV